MKQLAQILKALGDETRLEIVRMLMGRELCVCDILGAFSVSQSTISHHLKILKQAGLLIDSRDGKWIYYSINADIFEAVQEFLQSVIDKSVVKERCHICTDSAQGGKMKKSSGHSSSVWRE